MDRRCWTLLLLAACAGGGAPVESPVPPLPPAGTQTLVKNLTITGRPSAIADDHGLSIAAEESEMVPGSVVTLIEWSEQRAVARIPTCTVSPAAIDLVVSPAQFGNDRLFITVPWTPAGGTPVLAAFGPAGLPLVLSSQFVSNAVQAGISGADVAFLGGVQKGFTGPIEIELAVEEIPPQAPAAAARLRTLWTARTPSAKVVSANKIHVVIALRGLLSSEAGEAGLASFLTSKAPEEEHPGLLSPAFDLVAVFDYDVKDTIEHSGAALAGLIESNWGDPARYDVQLFGHGMGGLVARWAVEQVGAPSVTRLFTIGAPHQGMPAREMQELFLLTAGAASILGDAVPAGDALCPLAPGPLELIEGSDLLTKLSGSAPPGGVDFRAVGGTEANLDGAFAPLTGVLQAILAAELRLPADGLVPESSAFARAASVNLQEPYNHDALVRNIASYWVDMGGLTGIDRTIQILEPPSTKVSIDLNATATVSVIALGLHGDPLDPAPLFSGPAANPPLQWTVEEPETVALISQSQLSAGLLGLSPGGANLFVKDPATGANTRVTVEVGQKALINPSGAVLRVGAHQEFTAGLALGSSPAEDFPTWTLTGNGTISPIAGTLGVDYFAPSTPGVDVLTLEMKDLVGNLLGSASATIQIGP